MLLLYVVSRTVCLSAVIVAVVIVVVMVMVMVVVVIRATDAVSPVVWVAVSAISKVTEVSKVA